MRELVKQVHVVFWVVAVAVIGFYVTGLVMSVFNPLELWGFTAVVVLLAALFALHLRRVSRALSDKQAAGHDEVRRTLNRMRETRGF